MTRRQQLAAKKNGKNQEAAEGNGEGEAEGDHGDDDQNGQPVMKKPAARAKAAGKAKAAAKKQVQTEKATDAEPKAKSAAKRKARKSKAAEEQHEPEQEESEVPEGDQNLDSTKRRLFKDADQDPPAPAEEAVGADPPRKRRKRRTPAGDAADPSGQSKKSPEAKVKAKAAPRRRKGADGEDQKCEDGQEAQPKRRARKSRQQREAEEAVLASRMNMEDDVMKGVVLQVLREVKTMTVDELKDHLSSKKDSLAGKNSTLNVYWSRTNSRCKYLLDPATPDTANFYFTSGTWNTRLAAAFIGSWLMVTQRCLFFQRNQLHHRTFQEYTIYKHIFGPFFAVFTCHWNLPCFLRLVGWTPRMRLSYPSGKIRLQSLQWRKPRSSSTQTVPSKSSVASESLEPFATWPERLRVCTS